MTKTGYDQPRIALPAYTPVAGRVRSSVGGGFSVPEHYVHAVHRAGAVPYMLSAYDRRDPLAVLADFDALLLVGGGDVAPASYGGRPHPSIYGCEPERDVFECGLVLAAVHLRLPLLAICRGVQILNVARGGTLHPHLDDLPGRRSHRSTTSELLLHHVQVRPSSRLAQILGERVDRCSCRHHQALRDVGAGLRVVAEAADGTIEAVEGLRDDHWLVGVQWHPEDTAARDPRQQMLFDALAQQARQQAARREPDGRPP